MNVRAPHDLRTPPPAASASERPREIPAVEVSVCRTLPAEYTAYQESRADAGIFHDGRWGQVMNRAYGNDAFYLLARRGAAVVGVLQLVRQKSLLLGSHLCSLPYMDGAGIVADDDDACGRLMTAARELMTRLRARWVELRQYESVCDETPDRLDKVTLIMPLPSTTEELWRQIPSKPRNQIRKAQKAGTLGQCGGGELLEEFYQVYRRTMRDLGSPAHSRRFFEEIVQTFSGQTRIFIQRDMQRPLAAALTLMDGKTLRVPWAGSDWRYRHLAVNMLLYYDMMCDACQRGLTLMDFGRSTRGSGTYEFKARWGAQEHQLHWQYLLPPGQSMPALRADNPRFHLARSCWKHLPLNLASALGSRIIAKLS